MGELRGRRMPDTDGDAPDLYAWPEGAYGRTYSGWWCMAPGRHGGNLNAHQVVEHDDGTITVSPSILVTSGGDGRELFHGWLTAGMWTW
jgi:hypothetical protein